MNSSLRVILVVVIGLGVTGVILRPLTAPFRISGLKNQPTLASTPGGGTTFAASGGLRTLLADLAWLRAHLAWEKHDAATTEALLRVTTALDAQPLYFWLNGARILAYDIPVWNAAGQRSPSEQARLDREYARRALVYLGEALSHHPRSASLWIEHANIELHRVHDLPAAAESYRRASQQPDAPFYAARVHAELLRRMGDKAGALAVLIELYPRLPLNDESAAAGLVLSRIRALEAELAKSPGECFQVSSTPLPGSAFDMATNHSVESGT